MTVLNRPMFRYGGPIKEGIMSGIKEPKRGRVDGPGSYAGEEAAEIFKNVGQIITTDTPNPKVLNAAAQLGIGNPYRDIRQGALDKRVNFTPIKKNLITSSAAEDDISGLSSDFATTVRDKDTGRMIMQEPQGLSLEAQANLNLISATEYAQLKKAEQEAEKNKGTSIFTTEDDMREKVASGQIKPDVKLPGDKDDTPPPPTKKERVNTILESLGYDRAQKNALYDAMIKAGQRVSRGGLGAENLVSDIIAETSQSYDKPEKLREAANLMDVQQQLKLEQIKESKDTRSPLQKNAEYLLEAGVVDNSKDAVLAAQGKATEANDIFFEASQKLNASKALDQTALTLGARGKFGEGIVFKNKVPKKYKGKPIETFLESGAFRGDGLYTADGKIMLIQDGKIKSELIIRGSIEEGLFSFGGDD
jgi:hypothetical protein